MSKSPENVHELTVLVDKFIATRNISHAQYRKLSAIVLADGSIDEHELRQINRLFDAIRAGMVKVTD